MKLKLLCLTLFTTLISWSQATLPVTRTIWNGAEPTGWTESGTTDRLTTSACSGNNACIFDTTGDWLQINFSGTPDVLTFKLRNQAMTGISKLTVQQSADGSSWTTLGEYGSGASSFTNCGDITATLSATTRYVRWTYTKGAGNCDLDDVSITASATPQPEIDITGNANPILTGDTTPTTTDFTDFGSVSVGAPLQRSFIIANSGTADLSVSSVAFVGGNAADFSVTTSPTGTISAGQDRTLTITFTPSASGVRTTKVRIVNNDSNENPFEFDIRGNGSCSAGTISSVYPTSGPEGTEVTINASSGNLAGATVTFNGVAATVLSSSALQLVAIVPAGATTGNINITNASSCVAVTPFTVITQDKTSCDGSNMITDLFISEVTDASSGSLSYIEIYNATGTTVDMTNYTVRIINNGTSTVDIPLVGTLVNGDSFVYRTAVGSGCSVPGGDGSLADQNSGHSGINDNDCIRLLKNGTIIDVWGVCDGSNWTGALGTGYDFERKNNVAAPTTTFTATEWDITDWASCSDDYSNVASYGGVSSVPAITAQPSLALTCSSTNAVLSVAATEGFTGSKPLAYQWFVALPNTTGWTALSNGGVYSGVTTNTLTIASIAGLDGNQYYCQVRENLATCYIASKAVKIKDTFSTTWNGATWSNGMPSLTKSAVINGNYTTSANGNFECCSLLINNTFTLDITNGNHVVIQNNLTVNGTLEVRNQGSLVMVNNAGTVSGSGTTRVHKTSTLFELYDYTFFAPPVANAQINTFSGWQTNYIFKLNTAAFRDDNNDSHDDNLDAWVATPQAEVMTPGRGYAVMGLINQTYPAQQSATFTGAVNNGIINVPIQLSLDNTKANDDFNLIGNPYPSAINADDFIAANPNISGTLYFWTHVGNIQVAAINPGPQTYNFSPDDFAYYNLSGGTRAGLLAGGGGNNAAPTGRIASGQGFQVDANSNSNVVFNNGMRNKAYANNHFYKNGTAETVLEKDRIWLNLTNTEGIFSQQLVAFLPNATENEDWSYDGELAKSNNYAAFYSLINEKPFKIQARDAFHIHQRVPLGFTSAYEKSYTVSIDALEGVLETNNIYLQDLQLNLIHDLKASDYTFTTPAGMFNNRFILRFTTETEALDNPVFEPTTNTVTVYANEALHIKSSSENISEVVVYDVLGRILFQKQNCHSKEVVLHTLQQTKSMLVVKVKLENGREVTEKVWY